MITTQINLDLREPIEVNDLTIVLIRVSGERVKLEIRSREQPRLRRHVRQGAEAREGEQ